MQTPNTASLWNAGWRVACVAACLGCWLGGKAQVANDDCANAIPVTIWQTVHCPLPGFAEANYWEGDSTHNAVINYPYPSNPNPCSGYSSTMGPPGRDVWFHPPGWANVYQWEMTCSDTCHVSWWVGDCGALAPLECYTLLPNDPTYMHVQLPTSTESNQFRIQVVAKDPVVDIHFDACWTYYGVIAGGIPFVHTDPTPVTCFQDSVTVVQPSGSGAEDGSIAISMLDGNPPYAILWDDGSTEFTRTGLGAGAYGYSITDDVGCVTSDTIVLDLSTQLGGEIQRPELIRWSCDAASGNLVILPADAAGSCDLTLSDAMGRTLMEAPVPASGLLLPGWSSTGLRIAVFQFKDRPALRTKVPVCITR